MMGLLICLGCKHFKGLNTDGTVECEVLGETKPKLICMHFEARQSGKS